MTAIHEYKAADGEIITLRRSENLPDSLRRGGKVYRRVFYAPTSVVDRADAHPSISLPYNYKYAEQAGCKLDKRGRVIFTSNRARNELARIANDNGEHLIRPQDA